MHGHVWQSPKHVRTWPCECVLLTPSSTAVSFSLKLSERRIYPHPTNQASKQKEKLNFPPLSLENTKEFSPNNLTPSCVSSLTSSLPTGILLVIFMYSLILHIQVILTKLFHHQLSLSQNLLTIYIYPSPTEN